jgi:peptidoglycan/LPS O-acetylase OafA/YrhL
VLGTLVAAAAYELQLALRHEISPDGEGWILLLALVAMLVGAVVVYRNGGAAALIAPAAALFVTARFYTGDPYDKPGFQSYAEGNSPVWIFALLGLAFLAAATTLLWRRTAAVESAAVLLLLLVTAMFMGTH